MLMEFPKIFLSKLKNTFVYRTLINNIIVISIAILLFFLIYHNIFFLPLAVIYSIYMYKKNKLFIVITLLMIIVLLFKINLYNSNTDITVNGVIKIDDVIKYDKYQKLIYKRTYKRYIIYDFDNNDILPGDIIDVVTEKQIPLGERIEGSFDYAKYLKNNHIYGIYNLKEFKILKRNKYNINIIKYKLNSYINKKFSNESRVFLKALIIGDKNDFDDEFLNSLIGNGTIHLFAISGLHVGIIIAILKKILELINIKKNDLYISLFLLLYLFITSFSPSIIRAVIMYYLAVVNKKLKLMLSSSDIISITFLFLILINPLYIYNNGFVLSFSVSYFIILFSELIKRKKNFYQGFLISLFSNVFVLPIIINMNNEINFLSPIVNVLFISLMSTVILPFTFLVMVFPMFAKMYESIIKCFIKISIFFNENVSIKISFASLSNFSLALYYHLLISILYFFNSNNRSIRKWLIVVISIFIFFASVYSPTWKENEIIFFDLDEGDSTLIVDRDSQCVAMIDTGTGKNNEITKFLKRKGIKKIDYLFLTHNHNDHNGEASNIIKEINVNKIVVSAYDNSDFGKTNKTLIVKKGDNISCGGISFNILHPNKSYKDENDNSIIIHTKIGKHYFLFLGDATKETENKLINQNIKVDCIKISHHGSSTSTSPKMIEALKPKYAIIMAGRVKKFGFPNKKTIDTLNNFGVNIYRTDLDYTIVYSYNKDKAFFKKTRNTDVH